MDAKSGVTAPRWRAETRQRVDGSQGRAYLPLLRSQTLDTFT